MSLTLSALLPVFLVILLGWLLRRNDFPGKDFWHPAEQITYFVLLPSLFFHSTATTPLGDPDLIKVPLVLCGAILILTLLMLPVRKFISPNGPVFTSVYQGAIRFNSYIGIGIVKGLYGNDGVAVFAITVGILVPFVNVMCVWILSHYASEKKVKWRTIFYRILTNPLVLSCGLGIAANLLSFPLPRVSLDILSILGTAALPLGLLTVGAGLHFSELRSAKTPVVASSVLKLLFFPVLVYTIGTQVGLSGLPLAVGILVAALPSATSSYVLAKQMGGDTKVASLIIMAQTLLAMLTVPAILSTFLTH